MGFRDGRKGRLMKANSLTTGVSFRYPSNVVRRPPCFSSQVYFGDAGQGVLDDMIMGILTVGRSWFRVCFISMSSITTIVSTVGLMREEGTIEGEGGTEKCKAEVCRGASGDGVERLVGIARKEIKRDVEGYKWKKEELRIPAEGASAEAEGAAEDPYKTWYNPVKTTLLLLSRIFSVLPMPVFDDLCRTAVSKCLENLHLASGELSELEDKVRIKTPGSAIDNMTAGY